MYRGDKKNFGTRQLAKMEEHKKLPHIKTPDQVKDNLNKGESGAGSQVYFSYCSSCHQVDGEGDGNRFPPLVKSDWVTGDKDKLIDVILNGLEGPITVRGKSYNNSMPPHKFLSDDEIAQVSNYIRKTFNDDSNTVTADDVKKVRNKKSK